MTKEELKQEAEEWLRSTDNHLNEEKTHFLSESEYAERAYLAGAEPREKRIEELEAQIEKMKRCKICKHYQGESCNYHSNWVKDCKENGMKLFELKEIKEK